MPGILINTLFFLGILFLLVLVLTPIFYFFSKDKAAEVEAEQEDHETVA